MAFATDPELHARANEHARKIMNEEIGRMPLAKQLVAKLTPDYQRALAHLARTFVIGYAAAMEDSAAPSRSTRKVRR